jgi:regulator of nucleoside diphosphate kinase
MTHEATIYISETDRERLGHLIERVRNHGERSDLAYAKNLEDELELSEVVASQQVPADVITMRSRVRLKDLDTGNEAVFSIVFPSEANAEEDKVSVLAPLATALLGHRRGSTVQFQAPGRVRRLQILEILYQPESAGQYDL